MTVDPNKGLSDIKYNNLNLPYSITKGSDKIGYVYDVTDSKSANKVLELGCNCQKLKNDN
ncbi:MAG: hypothetical protein N4A72_05155 [Bacteroidales bacterium]|jgi:hypothetical protein|nr:hypothetical protein [Bacteroidales bacterium]